MARTNGKSEVDPQELDATHELPASDNAGDEAVTIESPSSRALTESGELHKLRVERDTLIDRLARLQAEFENARKRTTREQQDFREYAVADAIRALLPTLDSFERALQTGSAEKSEFRDGIELIYKQLQDALLKLGLRAIPAKGEPFDPHVHEAIEMVETTDAADHQILEELQRGYKLKDRLLRPSMVKVARNPKH
ncbi:MAG TPA: nucleotide exchange factor GrpE [Terriglobales bacterium]|nr:nucleotide exchange factor GrpE [Terriglobales bacterium]